jgi:signal transduction histidine kinase
MLAEPQVVVVWRDPKAEPLILGEAAAITGVAASRRVLAFGSWLDPERARTIENAVEALRRRGEAFACVLVTTRSRHIEVEGRPIGGAAVLRLRDVTGAKLEHAALAERYRKLEGEVSEVRNLLEAVPAPIWVRAANGRLAFANRAYAAAVEAVDPADAVARGLELLDSSARAEAVHIRAEGRVFAKRVPVIVAGARRVLDVLEVGSKSGTAGIGLEATEAETMRAELSRVVAAHRCTLDQLATAVAIFGADERLVFHNAAFRALFDLDAGFLDERPTDSAVLDWLRARRRLPEQADFRAWIAQLHEAYRALEPKEHWWHLPGGRSLRVVTNPNPEGGVTYLFDDITERIELESRYNALIRTQSETLDALAEAVAVFGSDGRLKLFNPAFVELWQLSPQALAERPHIETIGGWCRPLLDAPQDRRDQGGEDFSGGAGIDPWAAIQLAVTRLERRTPIGRRLERIDGSVLDCTAVPLPDGGTLVTFRDLSDSVKVERALIERNEALLAADALKNAFVGHVSYELRSPLTTIIGFAQLLDDPLIGPLNDKQRDYVHHITDSSAALLAIINDILDLATIDAGAMILDLGKVDVRSAVEAAAEGVRTRLAERGLKLDLRVPADIGSFIADEKRVRQVLFNLLSNAVGFSPQGENVILSAERCPHEIVFRIVDRGPGIPPELKERVFERFETHRLGSHHRGAGLGLAIVRSLMALHGGSIAIDFEPGQGTVAICTFPIYAMVGSKAAE